MLTNLLDNAIKFTEPGGRVTVRIEQTDAHVRLAVVDTGVGIAPEHLPHILERFYQGDPARSGAGSGLGLSICQWIALAHGGSIQAASEPGRGSTFTVLLPVEPSGPSTRSRGPEIG